MRISVSKQGLRSEDQETTEMSENRARQCDKPTQLCGSLCVEELVNRVSMYHETETQGRTGGTIAETQDRTGGTATETQGRTGGTVAETQGRTGGTATGTQGRTGGTAMETQGRTGGTATETQGRTGGTVAETEGRTGGTATETQGRTGGIATETQGRTGGTARDAFCKVRRSLERKQKRQGDSRNLEGTQVRRDFGRIYTRPQLF
jgi:hypothetical protein